MKKIFVIVVAVLAMFVLPALLPCTTLSSDHSTMALGDDIVIEDEPTPDMGTVSGIISLAGRGYGTEGTVIFTAIDGEGVETGAIYTQTVLITDNGRYSLELPPGQYTAKARTYVSNEEVAHEEVTYPIRINVVAGAEITNINFEFINSYTLIGSVRYGDMSLSDVTVSLYTNNEERRVAITNEEGSYRFSGLSRGTWNILFEKEGFRDITATIDMEKTSYFNTQMYRTGLPGINGFIGGYDFQHSMMIVGLVGMIVMIVLALMLRFYVSKNPKLILESDTGEEDEEKSEDIKN